MYSFHLFSKKPSFFFSFLISCFSPFLRRKNGEKHDIKNEKQAPFHHPGTFKLYKKVEYNQVERSMDRKKLLYKAGFFSLKRRDL
jgi:hypothetical protein